MWVFTLVLYSLVGVAFRWGFGGFRGFSVNTGIQDLGREFEAPEVVDYPPTKKQGKPS